uniref:Uncharacterized protein n=1 Tax=Polytomella parva TaxID=51329 RepID=A0A7S0UMR7_9CHLO|mmetsp:Transcript_11153/g.20168  ORF Transcript_11153/g.20168 Transcript_11153/m.20168 type:complete len:258 (+) Transcript_11153:43-816(+)
MAVNLAVVARKQCLSKLASATSIFQLKKNISYTCAFSSSATDIVTSDSNSNVTVTSETKEALIPSFARVAEPWVGEKEATYAAPVRVPEELWKNSRIPKILFQDPWNAPDYHETREKHAKLIHEYLKTQAEPVNAQQILKGIVEKHGNIMGTTDYIINHLDDMIAHNMAYEYKHVFSTPRKAKLSTLPRLFGANKYQMLLWGPPGEQSRRYEIVRKRALKIASTRLRTSKIPIIINRRIDDFSMFQYEKVNELMNKM